jgi:hypothetical protein
MGMTMTSVVLVGPVVAPDPIPTAEYRVTVITPGSCTPGAVSLTVLHGSHFGPDYRSHCSTVSLTPIDARRLADALMAAASAAEGG